MSNYFESFSGHNRGSSKGRTGVFGTSNLGSNPSPRANFKKGLSCGEALFKIAPGVVEENLEVSLP